MIFGILSILLRDHLGISREFSLIFLAVNLVLEEKRRHWNILNVEYHNDNQTGKTL
jgi:hypothetical protein